MDCPYSKIILESNMLAVSVGPQRFRLLLELTYILNTFSIIKLFIHHATRVHKFSKNLESTSKF